MNDIITLENGNNIPVNTTFSHGTLRRQDLIPMMLSVVRVVSPVYYETLLTEPYARDMQDEESEWWDSEESCEVFDDMFHFLDRKAPDGYYFGSHPGDGSDFGYWSIEDES